MTMDQERNAPGTESDPHRSAQQAESVDAQPRIFAQVRNRVRLSEQSFLPVLLGLAVIVTFFQVQNPAFLGSRNLSNLILQISMVGMVSVGIVIVLLTGQIDLSVGSVAGVSAAIFAILLVQHRVPLWLSVFAMLGFGAFAGLINGVLSTLIGAPAFVVTLAALLSWQGVQLQLLHSQTINVFNPTIGNLAGAYLSPALGWFMVVSAVVLFGVPNFYDSWQRSRRGLETAPIPIALAKTLGVAIVMLVVVLRLNQWHGVPFVGALFLVVVSGLGLIMKKSKYGRSIYAIGDNREAARRSGINVTAVLMSVFVISGLLAALGGLVAVSREAAATTLTGSGSFLLEVIAAAVIGGTSLFGGRGTVWSALLGALVIGSLSNGLDLIGQTAASKLIVEGLILVIAISGDALVRRRQRGGK